MFESIISNHPFVDGNKRPAYVLMRLLLLQYQLDIQAEQENKYTFVMLAASGEIKFDEIRLWISKYLVSTS